MPNWNQRLISGRPAAPAKEGGIGQAWYGRERPPSDAAGGEVTMLNTAKMKLAVQARKTK